MGPLEKELGRICFPFTFFAKFLSLESKTLKFTNSHQKPAKYQIYQNSTYKSLKMHKNPFLICVLIIDNNAMKSSQVLMRPFSNLLVIFEIN